MAAAGKNGVDFFFVLSGFIICYSNFIKAGVWSASGEYLKNRILRIYLPYLPISFLMLLSYRLFPGFSDATRNVSLVKSVFLLPVPGVTALAVAWTLVHEMFFYLVFITSFLSKRLFYFILLLWALMIGVASIYGLNMGTYFVTFVLSPYNLEFILGVSTAILAKSLLPIHRKWVITGFLAAILVLYFTPTILENKLLMGCLFAMLILLAINSPLNRISAGNIFMVLGNASYSIYLIHDPEISVFMRVFPKYGNVLYVVIIASFIFAVSCFSGIIYSRIFEQILLRKAKDLFKRKVAPNNNLAM